MSAMSNAASSSSSASSSSLRRENTPASVPASRSRDSESPDLSRSDQGRASGGASAALRLKRSNIVTLRAMDARAQNCNSTVLPLPLSTSLPSPRPHRIRIIGGRHRGRIVRFPAVPELRPTPDRVRETLFNWLGQDLTGRRTLDLYCGTGALSLEALSRGAAFAVAVDRNPALTRFVETVAASFGAAGLEAHVADAEAFLA